MVESLDGTLKVFVDSDMQVVRVEYLRDGKLVSRAESYSARTMDKDVTSRRRLALASAICAAKCVQVMAQKEVSDEHRG